MRTALRVRRRAPSYVDPGFSRAPSYVEAGFSRPAQPMTLRDGTAAEAMAIHGLVLDHLAEGHLLPRDEAEIAAHAARFVVAVQEDVVVACAELAPLSASVAEVRSFVVSRDARRHGVGRRLIDAIVARAQAGGFLKLCALTHSPGYFVHLGFSMVPHTWLPEKIARDCTGCRHFQHGLPTAARAAGGGWCGQYAVMRVLHHG